LGDVAVGGELPAMGGRRWAVGEKRRVILSEAKDLLSPEAERTAESGKPAGSRRRRQ
jgi:hypothetical protein